MVRQNNMIKWLKLFSNTQLYYSVDRTRQHGEKIHWCNGWGKLAKQKGLEDINQIKWKYQKPIKETSALAFKCEECDNTCEKETTLKTLTITKHMGFKNNSDQGEEICNNA